MSSNPAFGETMAEIVYSGDKPSHRHDLSWPASGEPDPPSGQIVRCICGRYFRWRYPNIDGSRSSPPGCLFAGGTVTLSVASGSGATTTGWVGGQAGDQVRPGRLCASPAAPRRRTPKALSLIHI